MKFACKNVSDLQENNICVKYQKQSIWIEKIHGPFMAALIYTAENHAQNFQFTTLWNNKKSNVNKRERKIKGKY